jgi:dienelactone hydrolase
MIRRQILISLFALGFVCNVFAFEDIKFEANDKTQSGEQLMLTGKLRKPEGKGPFPSIVMLHPCADISKHLDVWAERLVSWGYVTLQLDSFGPRGVICEPGVGSPADGKRAQDAHDAKAHLGKIPYVDANKIGLIGWGLGGTALTSALSKFTYIKNRGKPFTAAVAYCPFITQTLNDMDAPLLILHAEYDKIDNVDRLPLMVPSGKTEPELIYHIYPGANFGFDLEGLDGTIAGDAAKYNPEAARDAFRRTKEFFGKYLK